MQVGDGKRLRPFLLSTAGRYSGRFGLELPNKQIPRPTVRGNDSHKGKVGRTFENVIGRDFEADGPWEKMGTDVTEFKQPWGKA